LPLSHHHHQGGKMFHKVCCLLFVVVPSPGYMAQTHPHKFEQQKLLSQIGTLSPLHISADYSCLCCCWTQFDCVSSWWKDLNETVPPGDNPTILQESFFFKNMKERTSESMKEKPCILELNSAGHHLAPTSPVGR
jgi:hypothetical protein